MSKRTKKETKAEPLAGDPITEPLNPADEAEREIEAQRDEEVDQKAKPSKKAPTKKGLFSKAKDEIDQNIEAEREKLSTEIQQSQLALMLEKQPIFAEHAAIAKANGHTAIASNFKMLEDGIKQLKNRLVKADYFKKVGKPQ